jgi:hypothetical protein
MWNLFTERFAGVTTDEAGTTTYKDRSQSVFVLR